MAGNAFVSHVEKLKGRENYASWKFHMKALLCLNDEWDVFCGSAKPEDAKDKDRKALSKISLLIESDLIHHVERCTSAKEAWDTIQKLLEDSGLTRRVGLLRQLILTRLDSCNSMEDYVNQIILTSQRLRDMDFDISEEWIGTLLLAGLPEEYKPMIMGLESSGIQITANAIKVKLLQEVKTTNKSQTANQETALYSYPSTELKMKALRFWFRLCRRGPEALTSICLRDQMGNNNPLFWTTKIHRFLESRGMGDISNNIVRGGNVNEFDRTIRDRLREVSRQIPGLEMNERRTLANEFDRIVKERLRYVSRQQLVSEINEKRSLVVLRSFNINWERKEYIDCLIRHARRGYAWLRLGGWLQRRVKDSEENGICVLCGELEAWEHILIFCIATEPLRRNWLGMGEFGNRVRSGALAQEIMCYGNVEFLETCGTFLNKVKDLREHEIKVWEDR